MKTLKFNAELVPLIVSGEKTTTWRLWDDKNLTEGDMVNLIKRPELKVFARARLIKVWIKKFKDLNQGDEEGIGHERYKDLYQAYYKFYKKEVTPDTPVKIVKFEIVKLTG